MQIPNVIIVIEVKDGAVTCVTGTSDQVQVILIDHDVYAEGSVAPNTQWDDQPTYAKALPVDYVDEDSCELIFRDFQVAG